MNPECPVSSVSSRFFCLSRHADTPRHLLFELNADGSDYAVLSETDDEGFSEHWKVLHTVLEDAKEKLTRQEILDEWPADFIKPAPLTLWRWLENAVVANLVKHEGKGSKSAPFRYWLAEAEARWREDPLYEFWEMQKREFKLPFGSRRD